MAIVLQYDTTERQTETLNRHMRKSGDGKHHAHKIKQEQKDDNTKQRDRDLTKQINKKQTNKLPSKL